MDGESCPHTSPGLLGSHLSPPKPGQPSLQAGTGSHSSRDSFSVEKEMEAVSKRLAQKAAGPSLAPNFWILKLFDQVTGVVSIDCSITLFEFERVRCGVMPASCA